MKINWGLIVGKIGKYFGFILIILGFIAVCHRWYILGTITTEDLSGGAIPISLGIALFAIGLSYESDDKMKSIATADFFELTDRFWERAPPLYYPLESNIRDTGSWRLVNIFEQADKLKRWADPEVQNKLIQALATFLERLQPTDCEKFWVEFKNYISASVKAIGFNAEDEVKNTLIENLSYWLGSKLEEESNEEYLQRKGRELSTRGDTDTFERIDE